MFLSGWGHVLDKPNFLAKNKICFAIIIIILFNKNLLHLIAKYILLYINAYIKKFKEQNKKGISLYFFK